MDQSSLQWCSVLRKDGAGPSRPIPEQVEGSAWSLLPGASDLLHPPPVSAYADDVSVFVSSQRDVQCLQDALSSYQGRVLVASNGAATS